MASLLTGICYTYITWLFQYLRRLVCVDFEGNSKGKGVEKSAAIYTHVTDGLEY